MARKSARQIAAVIEQHAKPRPGAVAARAVGASLGRAVQLVGPSAIAMNAALALDRKRAEHAAKGVTGGWAVAGQVTAASSAALTTALVIHGYNMALASAAAKVATRSPRLAAIVGPLGLAISAGAAVWNGIKGAQQGGTTGSFLVGALGGGQVFTAQKQGRAFLGEPQPLPSFAPAPVTAPASSRDQRSSAGTYERTYTKGPKAGHTEIVRKG